MRPLPQTLNPTFRGHLSVCQNFLFVARPWMFSFWGGSYRFTRIPSHASVRYRFALVKVRRPSDSLILLVACPALNCPLLLFTALYCLLLPFTALCCSLLPFTALYLPFTALYCTLLPFTALYYPLLSFTPTVNTQFNPGPRALPKP